MTTIKQIAWPLYVGMWDNERAAMASKRADKYRQATIAKNIRLVNDHVSTAKAGALCK